MPIRIPDALPAAAQLESENIFVMTEYRALHQDIRPLRVLILNLMPTKIDSLPLDRTQRRPADIGTVPRQSKIDPILPGKFKDHATVQKGVGQVHRRITSACLEQNSSRPRN